MDFVAYPATTGFYLERSLRKKHNVITCGASISDEMIRQWNLENMHWPVVPQDIFRKSSAPLSETIDKLPNKWIPDLYLWVETGLSDVPPDLKNHTIQSIKLPSWMIYSFQDGSLLRGPFVPVFWLSPTENDGFWSANCLPWCSQILCLFSLLAGFLYCRV